MNVGELIEELKKYPKDTRVVIHGYEGGYNDTDGPEKVGLVLNYHKEWYMGKHERVEMTHEGSKKDEVAIVL